MKILLAGVTDLPWSAECSMQRALSRLGHQTAVFNYKAVEKKLALGLEAVSLNAVDKFASFLRSEASPVHSLMYYRINGRKEMGLELVKMAANQKFDLIILSNADTIDYTIIPALKKYAPVWYFFNGPLAQAKRINARLYAAGATWASATFSDAAAYLAAKSPNAIWLPQGVDTDIFQPRETKKLIDIVFAGPKTSKSKALVDTLLDSRVRVRCFGHGWDNSPVYHQELAEIYRMSKMALAVCPQGESLPQEALQAMACGTFALCERCKDIETLFGKGEQLDWFDNADEMASLAKNYLTEENRRELISQAGCEAVRGRHSWGKTMERIMEPVVLAERTP